MERRTLAGMEEEKGLGTPYKPAADCDGIAQRPERGNEIGTLLLVRATAHSSSSSPPAPTANFGDSSSRRIPL